MFDERPGVGRWAGVLAPVVLFAAIGVGWAASPRFAWPTDPFSVVGGGDGAVALAFNAGLVAAGACWLAFAAAVHAQRGRTASVPLGAVGVGFVLAGAFPIPHVVHAIGGSLVLFGVPVLLAADAVATWRAGHARPALALAAAAVGTVVLWVPYDLGLTALQLGYAVVELVAFAALAAWTAWTLRVTDAAGSTSNPVDRAPEDVDA